MATRKSGSILVVEDQEAWRDLLTAILEGDGHRVVTADTLQKGKRLLETERPDVVILDMRLADNVTHDIGGMALLKEVKESHPSAKAIILTGYPDADQKERAVGFYGADGYFEKAPGGGFLDVDVFRELIFDLLSEKA
jgi:DNA-binding NtrC family response regulator